MDSTEILSRRQSDSHIERSQSKKSLFLGLRSILSFDAAGIPYCTRYFLCSIHNGKKSKQKRSV